MKMNCHNLNKIKYLKNILNKIFLKKYILKRDYLVWVIEEELKKVGKNGIIAYFSCERGHHSFKKDVYILQPLKWETYMDVTDLEQIEGGDHLTVIHQQQEDVTSSVSTSHSGFDTSQGQVSVTFGML